jgi:hypothetical protein
MEDAKLSDECDGAPLKDGTHLLRETDEVFIQREKCTTEI